MVYDIIKDTSVLTTIPDKVLRKLITKEIYCINDAVEETRLSEGKITDLNIGLGILSIGVLDDKVFYKFVPSKELEDSVKASILNERNLLEDALEAALVDKLTNTYKVLL